MANPGTMFLAKNPDLPDRLSSFAMLVPFLIVSPWIKGVFELASHSDPLSFG
jgi:hypothetical protein